MIEERLLHRVQIVAVRKPLDGGDGLTLMSDGERKTRQGAAAVHQHSTGSALTLIAAFLATCEGEVLSQGV